MDKLLENIRSKYLPNASTSANAQSATSQTNSSGGDALLSDIRSRYGVTNNTFVPGTAKSEVVVAEKGKPATENRLGNVVSGGLKTSAGQYAGAARVQYEAGQGGRTQRNVEQMKELQWAVARAKADYDSAVAAGQSQGMVQATKNELDNYTTKLKAYADVLGEGVYDTALAEANSAAANLRNGSNADELYASLGKFELPAEGGIQEKATKATSQLVNDINESAAADIAEAKEGLGFGGQLLVDAGVGATQLAADAATNIIAPGVSRLALAQRVFGGSATEAEQAGASIGKQVTYGTAQAALEVALSAIGGILDPVYGTGFTDDVIEGFIDKIAKNSAAKTALKLLANAAGEGLEEAASAILSPALESIYNGKKVGENYSKETISNALYDALIGGTLGLVGGDVNIAANSTANALASAINRTSPNSSQMETANTGNATAKSTTDESGAEAIVEPATTQQMPAESDPLLRTMFGEQQKTADSEELTGDYLFEEHHGNILDGVRSHLPELDEMQAVAQLTGDEFQKTDGDTRNLRTKVIEFFNSIGNKVTRPNFGDIALNTAGVRDSLAHGYGKMKAATFASLPDVLKNGKLIGYNKNYLNRGYESFLIAAPVNIGENTGYVGALVIKDSTTQRYKLHEVLMVEKTGTTPFKTESDISVGDLRGDAPVIDNSNVTQPPKVVNNSANKNNTVGAAQQGFDPFTALQNQYGTLPSGENPVRSDDVPVSTNGTDRVSQSVVTEKGARVTPDEFVPLIENKTVKGGFSFIPITNDATVQKAMAEIENSDWDSALRDWTAKVRKGITGADVEAMGALLYNNAVNSGDFRLALDILADYNVSGRNAARALQARRILKKLEPQSRLYMIERSIQRMVDDMGLDQQITIPEAMLDAYTNAENEAVRDDVVGEIQQYVADNIPPTKMDKWKALRYTNMLGNFKTQVRNVVGNITMAAVSDAKNAVAAGLERLAGGKVDRAHSVGFGKELVDSAREDFAENRDYIVDEYKYDDNASADAFARGVMDKRTIFKWKPLEGYRTLTNYAMNNAKFGDEAFARRAYSRALASYLHANGVTADMFNDPSWRAENQQFIDKARVSAKKISQEATFRDHNTLSDWVIKIGRRADTPALGKAVAEGVLPFRRTPANILVRAAEYSPLGIVKNAIDIAKAKRGGDVNGSDIIDGIAKTLTGSGIFVLGMLLRNAGLLRGSADDDEKQQNFDELAGHQDYALELPDGTSVTIDWLTPASMPLFMGAELMDLIHDGGFELKDLEQSLLSIAEPMLEMSMLQGINDTLGNLQYTEGNNIGQLVGSAALSYLTQGLSNSLVGQITRSAKEESTMTYVDKESAIPAWMQKSLGTMARKTPGWDYNQIPYIDAWGRTEEQGDFMERLANNLFNPAFVSKVETDGVDTELQRLYDNLGDDAGGIFPTRADKSFSVDGETYNLSADEYVTYATAKGQYSRKYVESAINSAAYKSMSDGEKAKLIGNLYKYANYKAKRESVPSYDNTDFHKAANAEKAGITPAQFYSIKEKADTNNNGVTKGELNIFFANDNTLSAQKEDKLKAILFPQK